MPWTVTLAEFALAFYAAVTVLLAATSLYYGVLAVEWLARLAHGPPR
jgi:hypothetical protein